MNIEKQRILCMDYGDVRCGFAVSDPTGLLASGIGTVKISGLRFLIEHIKKMADEYGITLIVVGNPVNLNGTRGPKSAAAEELAGRIESETGIKTELFDERLSTMAAHRVMNETGTFGKKRKNTVDTLSAQIILQDYMDRHRNERSGEDGGAAAF